MIRLVLLLFPALLAAADFPTGQIVSSVSCAADASQSYALYLPSVYKPDHTWPLILAFDPGARGRIPVERYQAAAERYGYIVAGSNNSRNGSWDVSLSAARAMTADVFARFAVDQKLIYFAGMSGGARVALGLALGSKDVAGVFASSAGWPDAQPRKTAPFPVFGTAGTDDFNYREMRQLDRTLTSPHHLAIFNGGHQWLSSDLAVEAVEWMEIRNRRNPERVAQIYARRVADLDKLTSSRDLYLTLQALVADFAGTEDTGRFAARAAALGRDKAVRDALKKERDEEEREDREMQQTFAAEHRLSTPDDHGAALSELTERWKKLSAAANQPSDTPDRRIARRIMGGLSLGAAQRVTDPAYLAVVSKYRR